MTPKQFNALPKQATSPAINGELFCPGQINPKLKKGVVAKQGMTIMFFKVKILNGYLPSLDPTKLEFNHKTTILE